MKHFLHKTKSLTTLLALITLLLLPAMGWADNIIPIRTDVTGSTIKQDSLGGRYWSPQGGQACLSTNELLVTKGFNGATMV